MAIIDVRTLLQNEMRAAFPLAEERVAQFYAMQEYHLGWRDIDLAPTMSDPGKLLRPQLVLLACRAVGGDPAHALPLAAGLQLIHDFSLIHDDIEDQSDTRRGRTTVWKQWGIAQGVNTGDGMFVIAHMALHRMAAVGVAPVMVLDILRRFDQTILTICEGQFLDLHFEGDLDLREDDYLAMISRKTAGLIAATTGLGAMVGGAAPEQVEAMFDFGQRVGLTFQIQDDVLGIWGDPEMTGKPRAADLLRRKLSLPVIHGLRHSDEREELARLYRQDVMSEADAGLALRILDRAGSQAYTERIATRYHNEALAALDALCPPSPAAAAALASIRRIVESLPGRQV